MSRRLAHRLVSRRVRCRLRCRARCRCRFLHAPHRFLHAPRRLRLSFSALRLGALGPCSSRRLEPEARGRGGLKDPIGLEGTARHVLNVAAREHHPGASQHRRPRSRPTSAHDSAAGADVSFSGRVVVLSFNGRGPQRAAERAADAQRRVAIPRGTKLVKEGEPRARSLVVPRPAPVPFGRLGRADLQGEQRLGTLAARARAVPPCERRGQRRGHRTQAARRLLGATKGVAQSASVPPGGAAVEGGSTELGS